MFLFPTLSEEFSIFNLSAIRKFMKNLQILDIGSTCFCAHTSRCLFGQYSLKLY